MVSLGVVSELFKFPEISTKGTVFHLNGIYYRHKDGVAMGSPLGAAVANVFLTKMGLIILKLIKNA